MVTVQSSWADSPILTNGFLSGPEWNGAGKMPIPAGYLMVKNDAKYLYIALDMVGDKGNDVGTGDYFWFSVDVDNNHQITPYVDVNYGVPPGKPNNLGRQLCIGPGVWTTIINEVSPSICRIGFGSSPNSAVAHRIWELRLAFEELGVDLSDPGVLPVVRFGVRVSSTTPAFTFDYPAGFYTSFTNLHEIILSRTPGVSLPPGDVIGYVGLIPASTIHNGYATTTSPYPYVVTDAAFAGSMSLRGNRADLQNAWNKGARKYKIKHTHDGKTEYLRQSWGNYHKIGTIDVLESFWPDSNAFYPMVNPGEQYSIDQLLIQWYSVPDGPGIHEFQAEFFKPDGTPVAVPPHKLTLVVDNNMPEVKIDDILHNAKSVPPCAIEYMTSAADGVQAKITVWDAGGLLSSFALYAYYGAGQKDPIYSEVYTNPTPTVHKSWQGVKAKTVPAGVYVPPVTCAYQFRLWAYKRLTNGWTNIGYTEDTRHVTLIKPVATAPLIAQYLPEYPLGILGRDKIAADGSEPQKLGSETIP